MKYGVNSYMNTVQRIKQITTAFERQANRVLSKYQLTMSQMDTLMFLLSCGKKSVIQREIENALHLKNPTVSGILDRLERKDFIKRCPDPTNRRVNQIVLTEKSIGLQESAIKDINMLFDSLLIDLSEKEKEQFSGFLDKILERAESDL